jgi:hypothetical protein
MVACARARRLCVPHRSGPSERAGRVPSREVQQACGYPSTTFQMQTQTVRGYPAPDQRRVLRASEDVPDERLTQEPSMRRSVSASRELPSFGAVFVVSYVAFSIPVVAAGVATTHVGLHRTALVYCAAIAVLAAVAAGSLIFRSRPAPERRSGGCRAGRRYKRGTHTRGNCDR